jgi:hypothetical protein
MNLGEDILFGCYTGGVFLSVSEALETNIRQEK